MDERAPPVGWLRFRRKNGSHIGPRRKRLILRRPSAPPDTRTGPRRRLPTTDTAAPAATRQLRHEADRQRGSSPGCSPGPVRGARSIAQLPTADWGRTESTRPESLRFLLRATRLFAVSPVKHRNRSLPLGGTWAASVTDAGAARIKLSANSRELVKPDWRHKGQGVSLSGVRPREVVAESIGEKIAEMVDLCLQRSRLPS